VRIVAATVLEYSRALDGRSWNPVSRWTERRAPLLQIETGRGTIGVGEAWSQQRDIRQVLELLRARIAPAIVGITIETADDIHRMAEGYRAEVERDPDWPLAAAVSAVDIALWDALTQEEGVAVWQALRGTSNSVAVYASGGLYRDGAGLDNLANEIAQYRRAGFRAVKIKVGGARLSDDIERVRVVRRALDEGDELWVDAVNQLDASVAVEAVRSLQSAGATAIQAPVAFDDFASMARIDADSLPVIAGEAEHRHAGFANLLERRAVSMLQLNIGLCGGFSGAQQIALLAARREVPLTLQCHGTAVLLAASLQCGAALDRVRNAEYHRFHDHLHGALPPAMRHVANGIVAIGPEPGLGLAPLTQGPQWDGGTIEIWSRAGITDRSPAGMTR
jgi:L-alanine-DL-glutamate epimerase-like enolase superfamily enzyme